MGNDVIYRLISYFYLTLYGSYCDRIYSIKFILSHWDSMCLFNSLFTSLVDNEPLGRCKIIVFDYPVWERSSLVRRCSALVLCTAISDFQSRQLQPLH